MKKLCLFTVFLLLVYVASAQTKFSVPVPTLEQKYNVTRMLLYNNILGFITAAKNDGMSAEEFGKKQGAVFVPGWDENEGFEPFVNFCLNSWACAADSVKIIEQSNDKLVVMISSLYKPLENQGILFGCSVEDYTTFTNAVLKEIAVHLGHNFEMTWGEKGYRIVMTL